MRIVYAVGFLSTEYFMSGSSRSIKWIATSEETPDAAIVDATTHLKSTYGGEHQFFGVMKVEIPNPGEKA